MYADGNHLSTRLCPERNANLWVCDLHTSDKLHLHGSSSLPLVALNSFAMCINHLWLLRLRVGNDDLHGPLFLEGNLLSRSAIPAIQESLGSPNRDGLVFGTHESDERLNRSAPCCRANSFTSATTFGRPPGLPDWPFFHEVRLICPGHHYFLSCIVFVSPEGWRHPRFQGPA